MTEYYVKAAFVDGDAETLSASVDERVKLVVDGEIRATTLDGFVAYATRRAKADAAVDYAEQPDPHVYTVSCRVGAETHELVFGDPPEHRVVEWRVAAG